MHWLSYGFSFAQLKHSSEIIGGFFVYSYYTGYLENKKERGKRIQSSESKKLGWSKTMRLTWENVTMKQSLAFWGGSPGVVDMREEAWSGSGLFPVPAGKPEAPGNRRSVTLSQCWQILSVSVMTGTRTAWTQQSARDEGVDGFDFSLCVRLLSGPALFYASMRCTSLLKPWEK